MLWNIQRNLVVQNDAQPKTTKTIDHYTDYTIIKVMQTGHNPIENECSWLWSLEAQRAQLINAHITLSERN